jgi:cytochrome c553
MTMARRLIALVLAAASTAAFAQQPDSIWVLDTAATCANCHGEQGVQSSNGQSFLAPKLGGQRPAYFEAALRSYRGSTRDHFFMRGISSGLKADEIRALAQHFGGLQKDPVGATELKPMPDIVQRCVACHVPPTADNRASVFPVLAGQHEVYLKKALGDYLSGKRTHPTMSAVVRSADGAPLLSDGEVDTAVRWFASQPGLWVQ